MHAKCSEMLTFLNWHADREIFYVTPILFTERQVAIFVRFNCKIGLEPTNVPMAAVRTSGITLLEP